MSIVEEQAMSEQEQKKEPKTLSLAPAEKLMKECVGFQFNFTGTWPRGGRAWTKEKKSSIASEFGYEEESAFTARDNLYDSRCKPVKEVNELRGRISKYVHGLVLPVADAEAFAKVPGLYLLRRADVEQVDKKLLEFQVEMAGQASKFNASREEVLAASLAKLGAKNFDPKQYPAEWIFGCRWGYPDVTPPSYLEKLCPAAYARELQKLQNQMADTVNLASSEFLENFANVISSWAEKFDPFIRIYPDSTSPYYKYEGCRVIGRMTNIENPEISRGYCRITVRTKKTDTEAAKDVTLPDMRVSEYADLHPRADDRVRPISTNLVSNMQEIFARFRAVGDQLALGDSELEMLDNVQQHLKDVLSKSGNKEARDKDRAIAKALSQESFRSKTRKLLEPLADKLSIAIEAKKKPASRKLRV